MGESEQGNISQYTDRQAQITEDKAQLEIDLQEAAKRLIQAEQERQDATAEKKNLEAETSLIKKDIEDIDLAIQKLEQEKTNRDHTIKSLNDKRACCYGENFGMDKYKV